MLQTDLLFAFKDSLDLLVLKKHRIVGPLLRQIFETIHQIEYLNSNHKNTEKSLIDWFNNKSPRHYEYRNLIKEKYGKDKSVTLKLQYDAYSKFTHRTYLSLLYNYARKDNSIMGKFSTKKNFKIWYDEYWPLRQSISMYYAILGMFGRMMIENFKDYGILQKEEVENIWKLSMESEQILYGSLTDEAKKMLGI